MKGFTNAITPLAHCRFEHIGPNGFPRVALLVDGNRFVPWDAFVDDHALGLSNQKLYALAIGLMVDFMAARAMEFTGTALSYRRFFREFSNSLLLGTIRDGKCPYDLWWYGRTVSGTQRLLKNLFMFLEWISESADVISVLPSVRSSVAEQLKFWARWRIKKANSLLGHLKSRELERDRRQVHSALGLPLHQVTVSDAPDRFPDRYFRQLLNEGFKRHPKQRWSTLRDMLILLLLHGGGLRISEALSLWIDDVYPDPADPSSCIVRLYEPVEGTARYQDPSTGKMKNVSRKEYLNVVYNTVPRSMMSGSQHLGNKPNLYLVRDEKYTLVFWRNASFGRAFKALYSEYVLTRPRVTDHPYMCISPTGTPMTRKGYEKVYAAACRRIGLVPRKSLGTSPHGHRHSYVYALKQAGLSEKVVQLATHHRSATSQDVYDNLSIQDALNAIRATIKLEDTELLMSEDHQ